MKVVRFVLNQLYNDAAEMYCVFTEMLNIVGVLV